MNKIDKNLDKHISLNILPQWINKKCIYCGRKYPDTILNIEGHIHHNEPFRCLNTKQCNKAKKKK